MIQLTPDKLCLVLLNDELGERTFRFLVNRPVDDVRFILFRLDNNQGVSSFLAAQSFEGDTADGGTLFALELEEGAHFPSVLGRIALTIAEYLEVSLAETLLVRAKDSHSEPVQLSCMALDVFCEHFPESTEGYYGVEDYDNDVVIDLEAATWGSSRATGTDG